MNTSTHVFTLVIVLVLSAATAEAKDKPAETSRMEGMPETWAYVSEHEMTSPDNDHWWTAFNDSLLDSLVSEGISNNYNVSIAAHRMEIARQTLNQARSQYFPAFNFNGSWTKSRVSGAMTKADGQASSSSYFSLGIDMNWQIDLFGKITAQSRNRKALFQASRAQYDGMMLSIAAEIATYYVNLRVLQAQKQVADEHLASQEKIVEITTVRYQTGLASKLDVAQAQALFYSTKASVPSLDKAIRTTINSIALLLGVYPSEIEARLNRPAALPDFHRKVAVGIPMDLMRRRPDIVEAEYNVAAYAAQLGIAKKDFLPTLSLNGSAGTSAHDAGNLFKNNSLTYSIAPTLSWTIFEGMSRKYATAAAREQMEAAIDSYNLALMTAVNETNDAMADYHYTLEAMDLDQKVYDESAEAFKLSMEQYKSGLLSLTPIVDAQMNMLSYSNALVTQHGNALLALIDLYKALGGGWSE